MVAAAVGAFVGVGSAEHDDDEVEVDILVADAVAGMIAVVDELVQVAAQVFELVRS
jgi:hypothetical protein